jgi:hypothetical protein
MRKAHGNFSNIAASVYKFQTAGKRGLKVIKFLLFWCRCHRRDPVITAMFLIPTLIQNIITNIGTAIIFVSWVSQIRQAQVVTIAANNCHCSSTPHHLTFTV